VKVAIISVLAALSTLAVAALPWLEAASPPVQQAQCIVIGHGSDPYATVCPTANPS
jgi:hypothetical protein